MNLEQSLVREFMRAFDQETPEHPCIPSPEIMELRYKLIAEELAELDDAILNRDIVKVADALADLLYVVHGAAVAFGLDMEPIFNEVHRSNMSKIGAAKRADGKVLKPNSWTPPNLEPIIQAMKE